MNQKKIAFLSVVVNTFLTGGKILIGSLSGSLALLAEGLHSGMDILSSFIAYLGIRISGRSADRKYPYGYLRYESLAGAVIVLFLFFSSISIIYEGIKGLSRKALPQFTLLGIGIMAISLVANEVMARIKFRYGARYGSLALSSDAEHSRADAISSLGVLLGLVIARRYPFADGLLAIFIGIYIFQESVRLGKEIVDSLLDIASPETEKKIKQILAKQKIILASLKTRRIGGAVFAELKLKLSPYLKLNQVSSLSKKLEEILLTKIPELKQITITAESHDFSQSCVFSSFGERFRYQKGIKPLGPKKQGRRIAIPLTGEKLAERFGAKKYLIADVGEKNKVLRKEVIANPFWEKGASRGLKFLKAVSADEVWAKNIGPGAQKNLKDRGIKFKKLKKDLSYKILEKDFRSLLNLP